MLLVADVGNTDTVFGLFSPGGSLSQVWRAESSPRRTADEYAAFLDALLHGYGLGVSDIDELVIGSVVPAVTRNLIWFAEKHMQSAPLVVTGESPIGIPVEVDRPADVGPDRVINALAARAKWKPPLIVVDIGTATTFDVVNRQGAFVGGAIVAGPNTMLRALADKAARLPSLELARPPSVIGKSTVHAMQSGVFWGYVSLIDGLVDRIAKELGGKPRVIATGGWARVIAPACERIDEVSENLTLEGLRLAALALREKPAKKRSR